VCIYIYICVCVCVCMCVWCGVCVCVRVPEVVCYPPEVRVRCPSVSLSVLIAAAVRQL